MVVGSGWPTLVLTGSVGSSSRTALLRTNTHLRGRGYLVEMRHLLDPVPFGRNFLVGLAG